MFPLLLVAFIYPAFFYFLISYFMILLFLISEVSSSICKSALMNCIIIIVILIPFRPPNNIEFEGPLDKYLTECKKYSSHILHWRGKQAVDNAVVVGEPQLGTTPYLYCRPIEGRSVSSDCGSGKRNKPVGWREREREWETRVSSTELWHQTRGDVGVPWARCGMFSVRGGKGGGNVVDMCVHACADVCM